MAAEELIRKFRENEKNNAWVELFRVILLFSNNFLNVHFYLTYQVFFFFCFLTWF